MLAGGGLDALGSGSQSDGSHKLSVWCGTWNMAAAPPPPDLQPWLNAGDHDIYAIGAQEAERSIALSVLLPCKPRWLAAISAAFGIRDRPDDEYALLANADTGATSLVIVVRRSLLARICRLRRATIPAGFLSGTLPNKGGAGISLCIGATSLLFVSAHLAPHAHAISTRDQQMIRIDRLLAYHLLPGGGGGGGGGGGVGGGGGGGYDEESAGWPSASASFDRVFWMGDFNYRVEMSVRQAKAILETVMNPNGVIDPNGLGGDPDGLGGDPDGSAKGASAAIARLLSADQQTQLETAPALLRLHEAPIRFLPTYKLDKKTKYRTYSLKEKAKNERVPSWTDRVLFRANRSKSRERPHSANTTDTQAESAANPPAASALGVSPPRYALAADPAAEISQLSYSACVHPSLIGVSDHRPVLSTFLLSVELDKPPLPEKPPPPGLGGGLWSAIKRRTGAMRKGLSRSNPHALLFGRLPLTVEMGAIALLVVLFRR